MSHIPLLVDPLWLQSRPDARLVDLRWQAKGPPARERYDEGHLPGAAYVDLDRDLSRHGGPGRHPFPSEEQFAELLSRLGIGPDTHVVVYDEGHSSVAARLWFMLRAYGHEKASVLDGGMRAWTEAGLPLTREEPRIAPAPRRKLTLDRSRLAETAEVAARNSIVLDARAPERYRGDVEPIDRKAGHIPGALNAPWSANLTPAPFPASDSTLCGPKQPSPAEAPEGVQADCNRFSTNSPLPGKRNPSPHSARARHQDRVRAGVLRESAAACSWERARCRKF